MNTNQTPEPFTITRIIEPLEWTVISNALSGQPMLVFKTATMEQQQAGRVIGLHCAGKRVGCFPTESIIKQTCRTEALVAISLGAREL